MPILKKTTNKPISPSQILGLGNDIIEIARIARAIERHQEHFLRRLFTEQEISKARKHKDMAFHIAGRFAGKEAASKALGVGFGADLAWQDIEILNDDRGKPYIQLSSQACHRFQNPHLFISISHSKTVASAVVIHCKGENS